MSQDEQVLVVRKPDRTIHSCPIANQATLMALSNRLPAGQKWKFEVMAKSKAEALGAEDTNYVTQSNAIDKIAAANKAIEDRDVAIADLNAKLEALMAATGNTKAENVDISNVQKIVTPKKN